MKKIEELADAMIRHAKDDNKARIVVKLRQLAEDVREECAKVADEQSKKFPAEENAHKHTAYLIRSLKLFEGE